MASVQVPLSTLVLSMFSIIMNMCIFLYVHTASLNMACNHNAVNMLIWHNLFLKKMYLAFY